MPETESFEDLQKLKKAESAINKNLYWLSALLTFLSMAVVLVEFFSRGLFPEFNINILYVGILLLYSLHKELLHMLHEKTGKRHGEYFVYGWVILTATLYVINFFTRGYFTNTPNNNVLIETSFLTLEIMAIFILSRATKVLRAYYKK
jgi:hypothetical protein